MDAIDNWKEEKRSAYLYLALSDLEQNPVHKKLFFNLAAMANRQATIWEKKMVMAKITIPHYHPDLRVRFVIKLVQWFGARSLRVALAAMKIRGMSIYQAPHLGNSKFIDEESQVGNKGSQLIDKDSQVGNKGSQLIDKDSQVVNKGSQLIDKDSQAVNKGSQLIDKDSQVVNKDSQLFGKESQAVNQVPQLTDKSSQSIDKESLEKKHSIIRHGNNLRAAVFGINDGLVSNASLIFGIAGAGMAGHSLILTGVAGLLAGACSMGAGEYVSVRSQREMLEYQLALEKSELELYPEEEAAELALIYQARGLPKEEAEKVATLLIQNPDKALETLAREELGIDPTEMVSPWGAAISSFIAFALGALIPLLPLMLGDSIHPLLMTVLLTGLALFSVGAVLSLFTQRSALWGGVRMLLIGTSAGFFTYLIGHMIGVSV